MPTRQTAPIGAPTWIDLMSSDVGRSRDFYCQLLGWEAEEPDETYGGYFSFLKDGSRIAGCMGAQQGMPDAWSVYLSTDDAKKTLDAAVADGATTIVDTMTIEPNIGTMAFIADPTGAPIGIWQPGLHPGFTVFGEANTPSWFELNTRDYDGAVAFYRNVFRWDTETAIDTPEMRYTVMKDGDAQLAGIMDATAFLPEGVHSHWAVYFGVADADDTLARITKLGGSTVRPAEDTPYGRLAAAVDPVGAHFKLVAPNDQMPAR